MKKGKNRSDNTIVSPKSEYEVKYTSPVTPLDQITVKVMSLRLPEEPAKRFSIKVTFFDQLILTNIIKSIKIRDVVEEKIIAMGTMNYDPSDYEKMCMFANNPLVVNIQPLISIESNVSKLLMKSPSLTRGALSGTNPFNMAAETISCCNVDILPIFLGDEESETMCIKKRMQPMIKPSILRRKSWDNLPLITIELSVTRDSLNRHHHKLLSEANWMKLTLVAAYNLPVPFNDEFVYTAASKMPLQKSHFGLVTFSQGHRQSPRFKSTCFYPKWESLRVGDDVFSLSDEKFECKVEDIRDDENIDINHYMTEAPPYYNTVWRSFHRTLILQDPDQWFWDHLRRYKMPLELHIYGDTEGYSFMGFMDLFRLLYPGEDTVCLAVPLNWVNADQMSQKCGCDLLLTPNDKVTTPSYAATQKPSRITTPEVAGSADTLMTSGVRPTGADNCSAVVVLEVKLRRPMRKVRLPPHVSKQDVNEMLIEMEQQGPIKRECTGRGQLVRDWQSTVKSAASSLGRVPYYGMTEFCSFNRQLSETRTRVELSTSCWQEAAIYVNNNFLVDMYLHSDEMFEEMLMMAHACLMRVASSTLVGTESWKSTDPVIRAARHARQMQDTLHAMDLYLLFMVQKPRDASGWRELSTCLKDVNRDWAAVCINKSVVLDPRHPLTLLSKGSMVYEDNPDAAEPFFRALLAFYPFWLTGWVIASAYYVDRHLFLLADQIMDYVKRCRSEGTMEDLGYPRAWERELGDWWDPTPLLPGMSWYYDAADLLLRLRAMPLADVCLARALSEAGESAAYYHLVALSCRLRGDIENALCHVQIGLQKYGDINFLRTLEAECYHKMDDLPTAMASFDKSGTCVGAYSTLLSLLNREPQRVRAVLVDLVRRQPSAYAWLALADDWMTRAVIGEGGDANDTEEQMAAKTCAAASAVQALKWDRRAGRAWALLGTLVQPSARRMHCNRMADICGYEAGDVAESTTPSKQSLCHRLGIAPRECRCQMCKRIRV